MKSGEADRPPRFAFLRYQGLLKLKVDALSNPLIMRPTSSDNGTTNSLKFNELDNSEGAVR
ncbi:hypothetical protein, partial [Pseudomonas hunanensis]|uniref:hypothetical protein n=1 Tax=Pseudomonas hunanensis TaxID=1247546 RepID=UPI003824ED19